MPDEPVISEPQPIAIDVAPAEAPETQTPASGKGSKRRVVVAFFGSMTCLVGALLLVDRPAVEANLLDHLETPAVYTGISYSLFKTLEQVEMRPPAVPKSQRRSETPVVTTSDEQAVRQRIRSFEGAYPGLGLQNCAIAVAGELATADCRGTVQTAPTVENPAPASLHQQWLFRMQRDGQAWKIAEVSRSPIASLPE